MSAFKWSEIKKWAANYDIKPKKVGNEYVLNDISYKDLPDLVRAVYNIISGNKFIDHQKEYDSGKY